MTILPCWFSVLGHFAEHCHQQNVMYATLNKDPAKGAALEIESSGMHGIKQYLAGGVLCIDPTTATIALSSISQGGSSI